MQTYAVHIAEGVTTNGLLTVDGDGVRFETFPTQTALAVLARRPPDPKISWSLDRSSIRTISDLQGRTSAPRGVVGRILRALHVEPNGLRVEVLRDGAREQLVFDCAVSVYDLIRAYAS